MKALALITVILVGLVGFGIAVAAGDDSSASLPWRGGATEPASASTTRTAARADADPAQATEDADSYDAPANAEDEDAAAPAPAKTPAAAKSTPEPAATTTPKPKATPEPTAERKPARPRRTRAITLPDDSARPLNLIYLGDELLPSYRSAVTAEIVKHRRVVDQELVAAPGTPITGATFSDAPAGMDVIVLGVGTQDAVAGSSPRLFGRTYEAIVSGLLARSPQAKLVCVGTYAPSSVALDRRIARGCRHGAFAGVRGATGPQQIAARVLAHMRFE